MIATSTSIGLVTYWSMPSCRPVELVVPVGQRSHEHKRQVPKGGSIAVERFNTSKPGIGGMSISHKTRSGLSFSIATRAADSGRLVSRCPDALVAGRGGIYASSAHIY